MDTNKFYSLEISNVREETASSICVTFDVPDELDETFKFKQGQFLTMRAMINGEDVRRSYSICSGTHDGHMRVGIKRVNGGRFSNYANDTFKAGFRVDVMPPQGNFYTELDSENEKKSKSYSRMQHWGVHIIMKTELEFKTHTSYITLQLINHNYCIPLFL